MELARRANEASFAARMVTSVFEDEIQKVGNKHDPVDLVRGVVASTIIHPIPSYSPFLLFTVVTRLRGARSH